MIWLWSGRLRRTTEPEIRHSDFIVGLDYF